jgi:hypothetical protein
MGGVGGDDDGNDIEQKQQNRRPQQQNLVGLKHHSMILIINIILLSANTKLRFWSRCPHLGNELHTSTHAKLSSYPVTCVCQPSNLAGFYGQSLLFNVGVVTPMRRRHLALLHALGHVLVYGLSCTREQVESSMSNSSAVLSFFCLLHSTLPSWSG